MNYTIQLTTHIIHRQPHYRAQILLGDTVIATTLNAYPFNAGCGQAAAINDARAIVNQLVADRWFAPHTQVQAAPGGPNNGRDFVTTFALIVAICVILVAIIGG